jgi:hypothetical protein
VIIKALQKGRDLNLAFVFQKLLCFGVDGVSTFQGTKIGVTKQINTNYAPFSISVHYMAHKCNLAFKTLLTLGIVSNIMDLLQSCHAYFVHSPKRYLEFIKLTDMIETKELKMFKNVKTRWISLLDLLRIILVEYRPFLAKMAMDSSSNQAAKVLCFNLFSMSIDLNFVCLWFLKKIQVC